MLPELRDVLRYLFCTDDIWFGACDLDKSQKSMVTRIAINLGVL